MRYQHLLVTDASRSRGWARRTCATTHVRAPPRCGCAARAAPARRARAGGGSPHRRSEHRPCDQRSVGGVRTRVRRRTTAQPSARRSSSRCSHRILLTDRSEVCGEPIASSGRLGRARGLVGRCGRARRDGVSVLPFCERLWGDPEATANLVRAQVAALDLAVDGCATVRSVERPQWARGQPAPGDPLRARKPS